MVANLVTYSDAPSEADFRAIFDALNDATAPIAGRARLVPVAVLLHDYEGAVIGGLWGRTVYSWLTIEMLVVPALLRGRGIGSSVMGQAERIALERGCIGMQVATFDFQAVGFYERLGFSVFGVQEDMPPGHRQLFLSKRLGSGCPLSRE